MVRKSAKKSAPLYRQKLPERKESLPAPQSGNNSWALRDEPAAPAVPCAMRCVELFAGAGGLALAASNAGFAEVAEPLSGGPAEPCSIWPKRVACAEGVGCPLALEGSSP